MDRDFKKTPEKLPMVVDRLGVTAQTTQPAKTHRGDRRYL